MTGLKPAPPEKCPEHLLALGRLMVKIPSDAAPRVLLDGLLYAGALAVDDTFVYWTEENRLQRQVSKGHWRLVDPNA